MAHRLTRIVTRTGDDGSTGLGDGSRIGKDACRIAAIGDVDELNAVIGVLVACIGSPPGRASDADAARAAGAADAADSPVEADHAADPGRPAEVAALLRGVQHDLFAIGAELATPGWSKLAAERVAALEAAIDACNARLPPLAEFILPGGTPAAAQAHVARTVCRRAERHVVALAAQAAVMPASRQYLNRLSDLLFVLARTLNRHAGVADVGWDNRRD